MHLFEHNFLILNFPQSFARGKFRIKKWGKQSIVRELKFRNITTYNIKTALREINSEEYIATLYALIQKKNSLVKEYDIFKRKKRIVEYFLYRGFEPNCIYKAVNETIL